MPAVALAQASGEAVWPQFQGGPGHEGAAADGPAPPFREGWRFTTSDQTSVSGAVIVGDLAVTVGTDAVYGVALDDGSIEWEVPRDGGPVSVPAVAAGAGDELDLLLYLEGPRQDDDASPSPTPSPSPGEDEANTSDLVAIDLSDRSERWRITLGDRSVTGVTVAGDLAFVGDDSGTVTAVAATDGSVRWERDLGADGPCATFAGVVDAPVAVGDDLVVAVARDTDEGSVAVSGYDAADGACRWRFAARIGSTAVSAASVAGGRVVVGFSDRVVRALSAEDGAEVWREIVLSLFLPVSSPAITADGVFVADLGGGVYRLDPATGERAWGFQLNERVLRSSPVVSGGAVLVGTFDGRLVAIDATSGHLAWEGRATSGLVGTIAVASDVVIAVKGGGRPGLVAFEHDPAGRLVDEVSPTKVDLGALLGTWGAAAAATAVVAFAAGTLARRRFGDAFPAGDDLDEDEEDA